jgi:hypothetical protein
MNIRRSILCLALVGCGEEVHREMPGFDDSPIVGACGEGNAGDPYADCIDAFAPAGGASFGHAALPDIVLGPPHGVGGGSMDVAALGCAGRITLAFDAPGIVDAGGPDLLVFENAFATGDETFAEPGRVLVSDDGTAWAAFDCHVFDGWPPVGCAGVEPVLADGDPATDPDDAGGDAFDLADVGLPHARFVRIVDVTEEFYGERKWCGGDAGGFDLDAVAAVVRE